MEGDSGTPSQANNGRVVLIAMDGSSHSNYALQYYMDKIHVDRDTVLMLHVADYSACMSYGGMAVVPGDAALLSAMVQEETQRIDKYVATLEDKMKELRIRGEVLRSAGDAGEAVVAVAKNRNVDFIMTGCRGMGTIRRTLLGSVSDYIIHHASVPVFVCRHMQ